MPRLALLLLAAALSQGKGRASFVASGPAGLKIEGQTEDAAVLSDAEQITVSVPLASLKTGIDLRDKHLRDDLEAEKYPAAELRVKRAALAVPQGAEEVERTCDGDLTLHGQTHPVSFSYKAKRSGDGFDVEGTLRIDTRDFGIVIPSYLGITVKPEVQTHASFHVAQG